MKPTSQTGPSSAPASDEHQTVLRPGNQDVAASEAPSAVPSSNQDARGPEKRWKPKVNRQQSWSEQDMKHELLRGLLAMEQGKEAGFTETSRGA